MLCPASLPGRGLVGCGGVPVVLPPANFRRASGAHYSDAPPMRVIRCHFFYHYPRINADRSSVLACYLSLIAAFQSDGE